MLRIRISSGMAIQMKHNEISGWKAKLKKHKSGGKHRVAVTLKNMVQQISRCKAQGHFRLPMKLFLKCSHYITDWFSNFKTCMKKGEAPESSKIDREKETLV